MSAEPRLSLVRSDPPAVARRTGDDRGDMWLALSAVVIGLIPFVGLMMLGHWDERELGAATLLLLVGLRGLAGGLFRPRR